MFGRKPDGFPTVSRRPIATLEASDELTGSQAPLWAVRLQRRVEGRRIAMPSLHVSLNRTASRVGDLIWGSWRRTLGASVLILAVFAILVWLLAAGGLATLRHTSFPGHPYPPTGYYLNSFSNDPDDLIKTSDAAAVRSDLLNDGQIELKAVESGDPSLLGDADTGNRLAKLQQIIAQYSTQGIFARQQTHFDSIVVGRLADPNQLSTVTCVEEKGTATISYVAKSNGAVVRQESFRFDDKFWLVRINGRYLIADAQISNQPAGSG